MLYEEKQIETIPVGPLGLIPLKSCEDLGKKVDAWLVEWRKERESEHKTTIAFAGYQKDSYIIGAKTPRFGSGEAKGELTESVRGDDLYIMVDVCNYNMTYTMNGLKNHMSPDDHYQDLKRVIAAVGGKGRRINVIMPFLYESRQHKRTGRESLDCAMALRELVDMGVENIITFDAHDPRVQNAIPLKGFETVQPTYQFIKHLLKNEKDLQIDSDHMMVISPDEGGMGRAVGKAGFPRCAADRRHAVSGTGSEVPRCRQKTIPRNNGRSGSQHLPVRPLYVQQGLYRPQPGDARPRLDAGLLLQRRIRRHGQYGFRGPEPGNANTEYLRTPGRTQV